ncbi:hypothetical protein L1887_36659 [Cichorium endivia]|nr:hypothetical protein L1887_36659 [Cichorium endivia]
MVARNVQGGRKLQCTPSIFPHSSVTSDFEVGRGLYPQVHPKDDDLHNGVSAFRGSQQSLKGIREVNNIERFENQVMHTFKGLKVGVTHCCSNQKYTVSGLSKKATRYISSVLEDLEGKKDPEIIILTDYFREEWGTNIKYRACLFSIQKIN